MPPRTGAQWVATFTYDKIGRLVSTTQPDNSLTSTSYNDAGLRETSTDADPLGLRQKLVDSGA